MYGFYEEKPEAGSEFINSYEERELIDNVYCFNEDEGCWEILGEDSGRVLVSFEDGEWIEA